MIAFVSVLAVLGFAAIPTILCLECNMTDYSVTLTPESTIATRGEVVTLTCNTTLPATFPQWLINNDLFTVTHLPVGFAAGDSDLQFTFDGDVDIRCVFRLLSGGSIVNICSNLARVVTDGPRDELTTNSCQDVNIISFFNNVDGFIIDIVGLIGGNGDCNVSVSLTDCADSERHIEQNTQARNEIGAATIDVPDATFYGDDVTVIVQSCLACSTLKYYLPNVTLTDYRHIPRNYMGTVIDDLSNNFCDFGSLIEYTICIHSGGSNDCFSDPCGNRKVFTSLCPQSIQENEKVGLVVNEAENGTIVSMFCKRNVNCVGSISEVMVFNVALLVCDENAMYEAEETRCVCKEGYTGNGIVCSKETSGGGERSGGAIAGIVIAVVVCLIIPLGLLI
jgi:hypothetical protein